MKERAFSVAVLCQGGKNLDVETATARGSVPSHDYSSSFTVMFDLVKVVVTLYLILK